MNLNIKMETFYKVGFWCFLVNFFAGGMDLYVNHALLNVWGYILRISGLIFALALVLLFKSLAYPKLAKSEYEEPLDMDKVIAEAKNK